MTTKIRGACYSCGYPIAAAPGSEISCPMCSNVNQAITQGVTVPTWLVVGLGAFAAGVFFGPTILASTEAGSKYLAKQVRAKLER